MRYASGAHRTLPGADRDEDPSAPHRDLGGRGHHGGRGAGCFPALTAMEILPLLIGISVVVAIAVAGVFVWAVRSGQFDDLDTPAVRILTDDDESPPSG